MKKKILIVGLGEIGYRHFQAVLKCRSDINLFCADISLAAIERAKTYKIEIGSDKEVTFYDNIKNIQNELFDVTIIATASKIRRNIFESILNNGNILRNVIFEKVLFNDLNDYYMVKELIQKNNISAYVNCTGRENKDYQKLRERIKEAKYYKFSFRGSNWGLACNSIHKIDMIGFLTNYTGVNIQLDGSLLESKIYESKRQGYNEFYGIFSGKMGDNIDFVFECSHDNSPCIFDIYTDEGFYSIREGDKIIIHDRLCFKFESFELEYVSNVSTLVVDNLLNNRSVSLPSFEESIRYHVPMLEMFIKIQEKITGKNSNVCNIT